MKFLLTPLPYPLDALAPYMGSETLGYHWGKHHRAYVDNLNRLIEGTKFEDYTTLEDIMLRSDGAIYNNAAQVWNHQFFFEQFSKKAKLSPDGFLHSAIERDFGSLYAFVEEFSKVAKGWFGSGWVWLVCDEEGKLSIEATQNAVNPATTDGLRPLMTIDVWEHAYYLDYYNARGEYVDNFWHILDWSVVERRF